MQAGAAASVWLRLKRLTPAALRASQRLAAHAASTAGTPASAAITAGDNLGKTDTAQQQLVWWYPKLFVSGALLLASKAGRII